MDAILSRITSLTAHAAIADVLRNPKGLFALLGLVVLVIYGLSVGRTRALVSLLSIYVAYVLAVIFPFFSALSAKVPESYRSMALAGMFLALYVAAFVVLSSSLAHGRLTMGEISLWKVMIVSVFQIGLLTSMFIALVPAETGTRMLGPLYRWFGGQYALFGWAVASLLMMPFMRTTRTGVE